MVTLSQFNGANVLITGHTGFKGSWLAIWLDYLGANVTGVSLDIPSSPSHFNVTGLADRVIDRRLDIRNSGELKSLVHEVKPDYVFHLAAQALVRPSYDNPLDTMTTNGIGTANLLDSLRGLDKSVVAIMITSDKAYDNVEWVWGYRETDKLGGKDPYSASKGMAELAIRSYLHSYFNTPDSNILVGITRAGNVIGGGDWSVDRIVPDCVRSWSKGTAVDIRNPAATRPWQHVLEPLSGYLTLAVKLSQNRTLHGEAYNFGPPANQDHSVGELANEMAKYWNNVLWNDASQSSNSLHEAGLLRLNCDKALLELGWTPSLDFEETVKMTAEWYKSYYDNPDQSMYDYTASQIESFVNISKVISATAS